MNLMQNPTNSNILSRLPEVLQEGVCDYFSSPSEGISQDIDLDRFMDFAKNF